MMLKKFGIISLGFLSSLISTPSLAQKTDRLIVKFKNPSIINQLSDELLAKQLHVEKVHQQPLAGNLNLLFIESKHEVLKRLQNDPSITFAVKDKKGFFSPSSITTAQLSIPLTHELQWDHFQEPAGVMLESSAGKKDGGWHLSIGESTPPTVVAVLDTGIEMNARLVNNLLYDDKKQVIGWNFADNNRDLSDPTGHYHGTHVAGTIAANGIDNLGIGPKLKILPVKIPDSSGMFYESAVINGIYWALGQKVPGVPLNPYPAKVMNMSFGIDEGPGKEVEKCDLAMQTVVDDATKQGAVLVVAAGNNNSEDDLGAPAGCINTIRVSSTGPTGLRAYYSNYGRGVTYAAPGGDKRYQNGGILSTVKPGTGINSSGLDFKQGTSMASPHVAGLFGLAFAFKPTLTTEQAKKIIFSTTHNYGHSDDPEKNCRGLISCGHGIIDAEAALTALDEAYRFIINAPQIEKLKLQQQDCPEGKVKASASTILEKDAGASWQLIKNQCVTKSELDFPKVVVMDYSVTAKFGGIQYRIFPQGHCARIGWDGIGCH